MIRKANYLDIKDVTELIYEFYNESLVDFGLGIDTETIKKLAEDVINDHIIYVKEADNKLVGIIACLITGTFFNKYEKMCQELVWYVKKEYRNKRYGIELFNIMENRCKELRIDFINMGYMGNLNYSIMDKFYKIKGYKRFENQHIRKLP